MLRFFQHFFCVIVFSLCTLQCGQNIGEKTQPQNSESSAKQAKTVQVSVKGMSCMSCVRTITTAVEKLPGVESCKVELEQDKATVTLFTDSTSTEKLLSTIEEAGYTAALLPIEQHQ
jgi:copper chaperone CopZ